ncbi:hypothetical protein I7I51_06375 [Histoplasma capsulatum]|uniref:Uncharacterized protein n=1 Tax=Ajellomyces capsulatus TaxID=5037 RepID=A0A8A1MHN7_AJECA|nr:hypothetical protein I7I51_06375 [Histoplasma capsulatum]
MTTTGLAARVQFRQGKTFAAIACNIYFQPPRFKQDKAERGHDEMEKIFQGAGLVPFETPQVNGFPPSVPRITDLEDLPDSIFYMYGSLLPSFQPQLLRPGVGVWFLSPCSLVLTCAIGP